MSREMEAREIVLGMGPAPIIDSPIPPETLSDQEIRARALESATRMVNVDETGAAQVLVVDLARTFEAYTRDGR